MSIGRSVKDKKIVFVGDIGVGKTALIRQWVEGGFLAHYTSDVGVNFSRKDFNCHDDVYALQICDVAGQERFGNNLPDYLKNADAIILVFDQNRLTTFNAVAKWLGKVRECCDVDTPLMLVGNKSDYDDLNVPEESVTQFLVENHISTYANMSAKDEAIANEFDTFVEKHVIKSVKAMSEPERVWQQRLLGGSIGALAAGVVVGALILGGMLSGPIGWVLLGASLIVAGGFISGVLAADVYRENKGYLAEESEKTNGISVNAQMHQGLGASSELGKAPSLATEEMKPVETLASKVDQRSEVAETPVEQAGIELKQSPSR